MNLVCDNCGAEYRIDASKVPKKGGFITCKSCSNKIRVKPPEEAIPLAGAPEDPFAAAPAPGPADAPPPDAPMPAGQVPDPPMAHPQIPPTDNGIPLASSADAPPIATAPPAEDNPFALGGSDPLPPLPGEDTASVGSLTPDAPFTPSAPVTPSAPITPNAPISGAELAAALPDDIPMLADDEAIPLADDDDLLSLDESDLPAPALGALDLPAPAGPGDLPTPANPGLPGAMDLPASFSPDDTIQEPLVGQGLNDLPAPSLPSEEDATLPGLAYPEPAAAAFPEPSGYEVATSVDSYSLPTESADLPALAESDLPPLATDELPPLPEAGGVGNFHDLPMPTAPSDLPAPQIGDVTAPNLSAVDDLPAPSQVEFDGGGGASGLSEDLFSGVSSEIALNSGLPDPASSTGSVTDTGGHGIDSNPADASALPVETGTMPDLGQTEVDFPDPGGLVAPSLPDPGANDDIADAMGDDLSDEVPKKRKTSVALLGVLAAVVLGAVGVSVFAPELVGLGGDTTVLPKIPADIPEDPNDKTTAKPEDNKGAEPEPPKLPPAPKLTSSNVHALPYGQLKPSVSNYVAETDAAPGLTLFGYFRLASTFGDREAAEKLTELAPKKVNAAKIDDELLLSAALGSMVLNGKEGAAKKLGERALKSSKRDSALVEYVTGLAYRGKPAAKALKHFDRAVELDPGLVDASVARAELLFRKRGAEAEAEKALSAAVAEVPGPAIALRAARILIENDRFSAIEQVGKPLISSAQAEQLARGDQESFFTLLIAKNVWVADLEAATAAAKKWSEVSPSPRSYIAHARLQAAKGGDANAILRAGLENAANDGERAEILHEIGRTAIRSEDLEAAKKTLGEAKALAGKDAQGWVKLLEGDILAAKGQVPKAKAAYAASGRGRSKFVEPRLATLLAEANASGPNLAKLTQLEKRSNHPEVVFALADALNAKGNPGGAATLYQKGIWTSAASPEPLSRVVSWARTSAAAGDTERAYAQLQRIQETRPEDPDVVAELVGLAQKMGRVEEAVGWYERLLNSSPDNLDYTIRYAGALNDAGKFNEAETLLEKLHRDTPDAKSGRSLAELGRAVMEKDEVKARSLLNEAKRLEPSAEIYSLLAKVEARQQRYDTAIIALQEAVKLSGGNAAMRLELGLMQRQRGNPQDAVDNLKLVLRSEPGNTRAVLALGDALSSVGKHREALQSYQKAIRAGSQNAELQMNAALIQLQQLNQLPQAVKGLRKVIEVAPDMAEAHYYLGYAYKDMNRAADARSSLKKFLELDPENELAAEVEQELKNL